MFFIFESSTIVLIDISTYFLFIKFIKIITIAKFLSFILGAIFSYFGNKHAKYFIITISPYTFTAFIFLFIFRKKVFVYLISSGYEEWKYLVGSWSVWIYHLMYKMVTSNSTVIALHERLIKKNKGHVINSSTLNDKWLKNIKDAKLDKIRFLYVARVNPEKGIYEFLEIFKKINVDAEISIVGKTKNLNLCLFLEYLLKS